MSATYSGAVRTGFDRLSRLDERLLVSVRSKQSRLITQVMKTLTLAGEPRSWLVHGLVLAFVAGWSGCRLPALLTVGALVATATSQLLKRAFRRKRPDIAMPGFTALMDNPDAFSFPSGHTAVAFGVATALAAGNHWVATAELVLALAIGCSRVYLGAHYPADVVAGAVIGVASGALAANACAPFLTH